MSPDGDHRLLRPHDRRLALVADGDRERGGDPHEVAGVHLVEADVRVDVDVVAAYNAAVQTSLADTVWAATEGSRYKTADGIITNN